MSNEDGSTGVNLEDRLFAVHNIVRTAEGIPDAMNAQGERPSGQVWVMGKGLLLAEPLKIAGDPSRQWYVIDDSTEDQDSGRVAWRHRLLPVALIAEEGWLVNKIDLDILRQLERRVTDLA